MKSSCKPLLTLLLAGALMALSGCAPKYPKCDKDAHCKAGEYCVNGLCQQCRDDAQCGAGKTCNKGRCDAIPGYCRTAAECPDHQGCVDNRCQPCTSSAHCGPGATCNKGRCLAPGACVQDDDCPENSECINGRCATPPTASSAKGPCELPVVYFDYNEHLLTSEATATLNDAMTCLRKGAGRTVRLEGHCDPRGTEAYNFALGDRRAQSVARHLARLGAASGKLRKVSKGRIEAQGKDEQGWSRDRKVIFHWE